MRAEHKELAALVTEWQKSLIALEQKVYEQQQTEVQRLQQLQAQLQGQQALHAQLLQQQQQPQQQPSPQVLTARGMQQAPQATHDPYAQAGYHAAAYGAGAYGPSSGGRPSEAIAKKGSWQEYETDDGQARSRPPSA